MNIQVLPYDPTWKEKFEAEAKVIKQTFDQEWLRLYHIGSTSVPGLDAKPIIDILLVVENITYLDRHTKEFEELGYEVMGEFGISGRRYFRKGKQVRTHHIHAFQYDQLYDIQRHISFRDYLRANEKVRQAYGDKKRILATQFSREPEKYMDGKDAFVKQVEKEALLWFLDQQ